MIEGQIISVDTTVRWQIIVIAIKQDDRDIISDGAVLHLAGDVVIQIKTGNGRLRGFFLPHSLARIVKEQMAGVELSPVGSGW